MNSNARNISACLACAIASGSALQAQTMLLSNDGRYIETLAEYQTTDDQFGFDIRTREPASPFIDWADNAAIDIGRASGSVSMSSLLSDSSFLASGSAQAAAVYDVDTSVFTIGFATSRHIIGFDLSQTTTFSLIANLVANQYAQSFITVRQDTQHGTLLHDFSITDAMLSIDQQITLDAGTYFLEFRAESNHELHRAADRIGLASFDAAWSVVPAPPGALLPLGGLFALSRRRR